MAAKGGISKILVWALLAMLFVGIAGFGATNFSGTVRNVGSVGDKDISIQAYSRALRSEMSAFQAQIGQPVSFQDAQAFGLDQRTLAQLVTGRALDFEASELGLSVGDTELLQQIQNIQAFNGPDGSFDRDAYKYALENSGLNETEFEEQLREETARSILQGAVLAGTALPQSYLDTLVKFALEQRSFTWATVENEDLTTGIAVPSNEDLIAFYDANIAAYTTPETRQITYAWVTPDMIADSVEIDEATLRDAYTEQDAEFNKPERRLVERLVFPSDTAAQDAITRIQNGESSFEDEVTARGLELADVDLGDVTVQDLGDAGEAIFAATAGDVVGPEVSDFGPALFRMNAVLPEQSMPFEAAKEILRASLVGDRARRVLDGQIDTFEDLLAGGASIEELAAETDLELMQIGWHPALADGIASYPAFRSAAASITLDDFPSIMALDDGGLFALRLDEISEPAPIPFDDVRDQVATDWDADARSKALVTLAEDFAADLSEGKTFAAVGLTTTQKEVDLTRRDFVEGLPVDMLDSVFELKRGETRVIADAGRAVIVQLDAITEADLSSEDAQALSSALGDQAANDVAQDLFSAMASDIQSRAGITIDQQALNAVHANLQ